MEVLTTRFEPRLCRQCRKMYTPRTTLQKVCTLVCAIVESRNKRAGFPPGTQREN